MRGASTSTSPPAPPVEQRRALELGARWAGGVETRPPVALDAAVTFAPVGVVVAAALCELDRGGIVAINAIHLDQLPAMPYDGPCWERSIRSVANVTREDATEYLELAARIGLTTDIERIRWPTRMSRSRGWRTGRWPGRQS